MEYRERGALGRDLRVRKETAVRGEERSPSRRGDVGVEGSERGVVVEGFGRAGYCAVLGQRMHGRGYNCGYRTVDWGSLVILKWRGEAAEEEAGGR